ERVRDTGEHRLGLHQIGRRKWNAESAESARKTRQYLQRFPRQFRALRVPLSFRRWVHSCSTQVSFEPPPWLELTTRLPFLRATRVRPPGTMVVSSPVRMNGRRSTWRGSTPPSMKVGAVESWIVGWAM